MMQSRELFRKLALACGSATLLATAFVPAGQASGAAGVPSLAKAATTAATENGPTPSPNSEHKNHTVTNPPAPGPDAPKPGVKPPAPQSRLKSALAAAGIAAPASSLPSGPCFLTTATATCDLWAKTGMLTFPGSVPPLPVWGFATSRTGPAQVPGPVLIANAGQSIRIHVHNLLPSGPNNNQLSIEVPASSIRPDLNGIDNGEDRTYTIGALKPGTYLYEAGPTANGARQVRMGLAGILIVRPSNFSGTNGCNCAYGNGNGGTDSFVDEATLQLNEFDPAFNQDPFLADPVEFSPTVFTINGHAFGDPLADALNKINVIGGDVLLLHYANLSDHERGITIANERQTVLADDSYVLTNPTDVATKWLNPGQVSDSFVKVDPSFPPGTHVPVYDAGLHLSNGADLGLGGMFTYLDVIKGIAGSPNGPVTTVALDASTNSGTEILTVNGTITPSAGATVTGAEWFLDNPATPGTAATCTTGGLSIISGGSGYTNPTVVFASTSGTGAAATVTGSIDAITVKGGGGYTNPTVIIPGTAAATASGSVDAVNLTTPGTHYIAPAVGFSGGGGSGAIARTTGPVDGLKLGTPGAGYHSPSVGFSVGDGSGAKATVSGSVDGVKLTNGASYTTPVVTLSGGGAATEATVSVSGVVDSLTVGAGGTGYSSTPSVSITGVGGVGGGATATAQVTSGVITGLTIVNAGSGFTQAPTVTITDATGSGAKASSTINVSAVTFTGGAGYTSAPNIKIDDSNSVKGTGAAATATISVTKLTLDAGGSLYSSAPKVTISDTGTPGTAAAATSTVAVTGFTLVSGGSGYASRPDVTISDGSLPAGTGATAAATLVLTTIKVNNPGSLYNPAPSVTINDPTGKGATAIATLTVNAITLTNPGSGYRTPPDLSIVDQPTHGTGATAMASLPSKLCIYQHLTVNPDGTFSFPIASADLNYLLIYALNRDGDHIIWVHGQDSNGTWGVVAGDVFTYDKTGPVVGALSVHSSPTNGKRPTDVANGGGPAVLVNGIPTKQNAPSNDLVILGTAAASLSNFVVTAAEYCIDVTPCPAIPKTANPNGATSMIVTPNGSDGTVQIDAYGATLLTPIACTPLPSPPGVTSPSPGAAPGGGSIVSFCGTVPESLLKNLSEGPHTLFIHACEQLSTSTGGCAMQLPAARWADFSRDASIGFVIDTKGPLATAVNLDPSPNNGHLTSSGNLNFLDSLQLAATLDDSKTGNSNIAYAEVIVTCSPDSLATPLCPSINGPIDPATKAAPADGSGAEMIPSGAAWDSPNKLAFAYIPLAELTAYPEGLVRFWVHAQDQAGNFGPWAHKDLTLDTTPPVFDSPVLPAPTAAPNTVHCTATACDPINFTASDPLHGGVRSYIVQVEWFIDQGVQVICEANVPGCTPEVAVLSDPGYGSATPGAFTDPLGTTRSGTITVGPQAPGTKIVFRVKDAAGNWSLDNLVVTT